MSQKRINTGRVTKHQKIKILELMRSNPLTACGQFGGPNSAKSNADFWRDAALELNACGGASKTSEQWKKCWVDWKSNVKKQQCAYNRFKRQTGNLPANEGPKPVEGIDAEVLAFFAADVVDGDGHTEESGIYPEAAKEVEIEEYEDVVYLDDSSIRTSVPTDPVQLPNISTVTSGQKKNTATYASALEEATKMQQQHHAEQMEVLTAILHCVQNIEAKICK